MSGWRAQKSTSLVLLEYPMFALLLNEYITYWFLSTTCRSIIVSITSDIRTIRSEVFLVRILHFLSLFKLHFSCYLASMSDWLQAYCEHSSLSLLLVGWDRSMKYLNLPISSAKSFWNVCSTILFHLLKTWSCRCLLHHTAWDFHVLTGLDMTSLGMSVLMCKVSIIFNVSCSNCYFCMILLPFPR